MKLKSLIIIVLGIVSTNSFAQDIHFSNMEFSPMTLNPALAGANYDLQAISNYRTQWNAVPGAAPFNTIAVSADMRLNPNKRQRSGNLAAGINFFNDQAGVNRISTNNVAISLAYHLFVGDNSTIGLGLQSGFGQRTLDAANGMWGSQYDGIQYNSSLSSGENLGTPSFSYLDAGAGVVYTYGTDESRMRANDNVRINAGYAVFHVNRPSFSFTGGDDNLYMRHSLFANASISVGSTNFAIEPGVYTQVQGPSTEILMGSDIRVLLKEGSKVTGNIQRTSVAMGVFYRNRDAVVARAMFNYSGMAIGFSYDFNISSLTEVTNARGGAEFFLRWIMDSPLNATKARI
jgi:type IX secretion system PorP/SprF family membrane protein